MRDFEKELERAMIVAQIKQEMLNIEIWQNFILKWSSLAKSNNNIAKNVGYAQARIDVLLVKIKNYIKEYEKC